jgi:hypothetical protein
MTEFCEDGHLRRPWLCSIIERVPQTWHSAVLHLSLAISVQSQLGITTTRSLSRATSSYFLRK